VGQKTEETRKLGNVELRTKHGVSGKSRDDLSNRSPPGECLLGGKRCKGGEESGRDLIRRELSARKLREKKFCGLRVGTGDVLEKKRRGAPNGASRKVTEEGTRESQMFPKGKKCREPTAVEKGRRFLVENGYHRIHVNNRGREVGFTYGHKR